MIPQKLVLEGVYSYRERQTIDFATLSEAGIFGVFGNVGSGKSAILESMTYALYGQIERLNQSDGRGYNIMNLQSSSLFIDFEFLQKGERYRFSVSAKRQKKDFTQIGTPKRSAYKMEAGEWIPLPDEGIRGGITAEEIIGLSYEHFRKTVIIPQGKFQEFIQLPPAQRTSMIETLFSLQRFNLSARCSTLLARSREEVSFLEGRLQDLQDLKEEDLGDLQDKALHDGEILKDMNNRKDVLSASLSELRELAKIRRAYEETSKTAQEMKGRMDALLREESLLETARLLEEQFSPLLARQEELKAEEEELSEEKEILARRMTQTEEDLSRGAEEWNLLKTDQENYAVLKRTLDALQARKEINELSRTLDRDRLRKEAVSGSLKADRSRKKELEIQAAAKRKELGEIERSLDDSRELNSLDQWYAEQQQLQRQINAARETVRSLEEKNREMRGEILPLLTEPFPEEAGAEALRKALFNQSARIDKDLRNQEETLEEQWYEAELKSGLSRMAPLLKEGEPCPLCGSSHHPSPAEPTGEADELERKKLDLKRKREALLKDRERVQQTLPALEFGEEELSRNRTALKERESEEAEHRRAFSWSPFSPDSREDFDRHRAGIEEQGRRLKTCRLDLESLDNEIRRIDGTIAEKERETVRLETGCGHLAGQIEKLEEKAEIPDDTAEADSIESLERRLAAVDRDFQKIRTLRREKEETLLDLQSSMKSCSLLLEKSFKENDILSERIREAMKAHEIESLEELQKLLIPTEERNKRLERTLSFRREKEIQESRLDSLKKELENLEKKTSGASLSETEESLQILNEELQEHLARSGALKEQIRDLTAKLTLKTSLTEDLEKQQSRLEDLKELYNLFKGGKFVQYIASVYMQELCAMANRRFSPLSNRSLELVFEDNQIMVRDFLNEGRLRHVKTLSGGQSFQAALCLALALSEQTGRGKGSFFFLDEGFGSLDKSSLETVMATLRQLSREGRIIGLISHVEDMQQDLDVWLKITRDPERGSLIGCSWEKGQRL